MSAHKNNVTPQTSPATTETPSGSTNKPKQLDTSDDTHNTDALNNVSSPSKPPSPSMRQHSNGVGQVDADGFGSIEGVDFDEVGLYKPHSHYVDALLTDQYQISMAYGYWQAEKHNDHSVFDLFFRKPPFDGEFTIFAGLEECLRFIHSYRFNEVMIGALKTKFPTWKAEFWVWLQSLNPTVLKIYAIAEGSIVIPNVPLIRVEGPLALCQLLETTLLTLVNFPSLIATNAARHRLACGPNKNLIEFGTRRAQGPDGAMSATRYAYIGGFDATSNVRAGLQFNIPISGTHAHAFVTSFTSLNEINRRTLKRKKVEPHLKPQHPASTHSNTNSNNSTPTSKHPSDNNNDHKQQSDNHEDDDFVASVLRYRKELKRTSTHQGELAAFISYALAFPDGYLALLDTYDTLESGIWNFIVVALALCEFGYTPKGVRLDSGDLAYLSRECRKIFIKVGDMYHIPTLAKMTIVASNDISEQVLFALKEQGHEIDSFGIGTHLVTCKTQPALGCVYKLTQVNDQPRMKLSNDSNKITIPGRKEAYRLHNAADEPVLDLLIPVGTPVSCV